MKQFATIAIVALLIGLAMTDALAQDDQASPEEIAAAIETIQAAEAAREAKSAYADIARRALDSVELRQAYLQRVLEFNQANYGTNAAEQLLKLDPDDLNALRIAAYGRAMEDDYAGALDAALQAGIRATNDEITMNSLGQLVAYMQLDDEAPEMSDEAATLLNDLAEALAGIDAYAAGHGRLAEAYGTYLTGLDEVATALADATAAREAIETTMAELEAQLETILENKREIQRQMNAQGGGAGGASGQQQVPPEMEEVQKQEMECRASIKTAENDIKRIARQFREAEDDYEDYAKDKSRIIRREGGLLDFDKPVALTGEPTPLAGADLPDPEPNTPAQPETPVAPVAPETGTDEAPEASADGALLLDNDSDGDKLIAQGQEYWMLDNSLPDRQGDTFVHDNNTGKGLAQIGMMFTPAEAGSYNVMVYCPTFGQAATNVPVEIHHAGGIANTTYDQRNNGGAWVTLGTYTFNTDTAGAVLFKNEGTDGYVMFDAIKLVAAQPVVIGQPIALPVGD